MTRFLKTLFQYEILLKALYNASLSLHGLDFTNIYLRRIVKTRRHKGCIAAMMPSSERYHKLLRSQDMFLENRFAMNEDYNTHQTHNVNTRTSLSRNNNNMIFLFLDVID